MIKNYFKTAWRNLVRNKLFSLINIFGLSIGMVSYLLILEYTNFELSYDRFNKNASNIYRIYNDRYQNGKLIQHSAMSYSAVSKAMQDDFPEIIAHTRIFPGGTNVVNGYNGKKLDEQKGLYVENSFLTVFSYTLLAGDSKTALAAPFCVVITQSMAQMLFNINDNNVAAVLGKIISIEPGQNLLKITGVCRDAPKNSHLQFDYLYSYITLYTHKNAWKAADYDFTISQFRHYIMLKPGTNYKALEAKFADFSRRHFPSNIHTGNSENFYLQPLLKVHMYSDFEYDIAITTKATVVWGLLVIALLILIIAWINYINLTTAKSIERAKEVGVRKVAGATNRQLVLQFMTESFIINIFSLVIALIVIFILQGVFNTLIDNQLSPANLFEKSIGGYSFSVLLIAFIVAGIFISGFYPSLVLLSFKPILVLKGRFYNSLKGLVFRKVLVISQFTIAVVIIISSLVVSKQMRFISKQNLGLNISQMLIVKAPRFADWDSTLLPKDNIFMNEIKKIPGVLGAAFSAKLPGDELRSNADIRRNDLLGESHFTIRDNFISPDFIALYQIKMLAGRTLLKTDCEANGIVGLRNLVLNLAAIKILGYKSPENAIGRQVLWSGDQYNIVGVVDDFYQRSMHYPIEPVMFMTGTDPFMPFSVKVDPHHLSSTINAIKQEYNNIFPGNIFNYFFLDEKFNRQYSTDRLFGRMFGLFSGVAISIACIGLLGLSLFATFQRTKEIGIRKVLGASAGNIVIMLSKDFMGLVLLAILIASPIAWYIMHYWLQNFVNRINLTLWLFIGPGLMTAIIAFITVSFQSVKTALANPVKSLHSE